MSTKQQDFPVGGARQAVEEALCSRGFVMSKWSDKLWSRPDGLQAHVFGAGSRLRVYRGKELVIEDKMAVALAKIDVLSVRE